MASILYTVNEDTGLGISLLVREDIDPTAINIGQSFYVVNGAWCGVYINGTIKFFNNISNEKEVVIGDVNVERNIGGGHYNDILNNFEIKLLEHRQIIRDNISNSSTLDDDFQKVLSDNILDLF